MAIHVVARKTFRFCHPRYSSSVDRARLAAVRYEGQEVQPGQCLIRANPVEIQELPDWVVKDPLFALAVKDTSIRIIRSDVPEKDWARLKVPPREMDGVVAKTIDQLDGPPAEQSRRIDNTITQEELKTRGRKKTSLTGVSSATPE